MEPVRTEVDGVPAVWTRGGGDRPLVLGLAFRVGRADETLARGGITHLVEHLVLHQVGVTDYHFNGSTGPIVTTFVIRGGPDDVCRFVETVCAGLRRLPEERFEYERTVLRTEAQGTNRGGVDRLPVWRYGPATYGLPAYPEFGLADHTIETVQAWATDWFTRGNVVVWCSGGPPPAGLRLDLPDGPRRPPPTPTSALRRLPAYFTADVNGVAFDTVLPRSTAANAYATIAARRLRTVMRQELGLSSSATAAYERRDATHAVVTAVADATRDRRDQLAGPFLDILVDLATGAVTEDDLRSFRSQAEQDMANPAAAAAVASSAAFDVLVGVEPQTFDEIRAEIAALDTAGITAVAKEALRGGLMVLPPGQAVGRAGFTEAPSSSGMRVYGREYSPVGGGDQRLVVADNGVSIVTERTAVTAIFSEAAGMIAYPDGARVLFAPDGVAVAIEPNLWEIPPVVLKRIDESLPSERVATMPARPPEAIPSPAPATPGRMVAESSPRGSSNILLGIGVGLFILLAVGVGVFAIAEGHSICPAIGAGLAAAWMVNRMRSRRQ